MIRAKTKSFSKLLAMEKRIFPMLSPLKKTFNAKKS